MRSMLLVLALPAAVAAQDVSFNHRPEGPAFGGELVRPEGPGPWPAVLLVPPSGHARDELREGGQHLADLARRLAALGIASLRVDPRGVGGSRHDTWPAWSWDVSWDALAADTAGHLRYLRQVPGVDRHRVGILAHGDATPLAARVAAETVPAFAILLAPMAARGAQTLVRQQLARLPASIDAERREALSSAMLSALELLASEGDTEAARTALAGCFAQLGLPAEQAATRAGAFAAEFGQGWHRAFLRTDPQTALREISCPLLALAASDDERYQASFHLRGVEKIMQRASAYNVRVVELAEGGHFVDRVDGERRDHLTQEAVRAIARFVADATGFVPEPDLPAGMPAPAPPLALTGIHVVDVAEGRIIRSSTILIDDGRITDVSARAVPEGVTAIDGSGWYALPGLCDMHVHLSLWGPDALARFVAHGVLSVRDMGGDLAQLLAWRARCAEGTWLGPRVSLTGPFLDGHKPNDLYRRPVLTREDIGPAVQELSGAGVDLLKVHSQLPRDVLPYLAARAAQSGLHLAGHVPAGVTPLEASASLRSLEHADGLLSALVRAEPPVVTGWDQSVAWWRSEQGAQALEGMARNGTWLTPTLTTVDTGARQVGGIFRAARAWAMQTTALARAAGLPMLAGTDCARALTGIEPGASLHRELELLCEAGLTATEALRTATLEPARFFGTERQRGRIAPGHDADLVLLDANPLDDIANTRRIRAVVLRGHLLDRARLDAVLRAAAALRE